MSLTRLPRLLSFYRKIPSVQVVVGGNANAVWGAASSESTRRRLFSTVNDSGKQRISLTLYRQLLRWCDYTSDDIPLSFYVPPIYIQSPQVDQQGLSDLVEAAAAKDSIDDVKNKKIQRVTLPFNSIIQTKQLACPVHTSADAKAFFRAIFRLNASQADGDLQKQRISLAFEALKSLNELTQTLETLKQSQQSHMDRSNVYFRVGQVVQHKLEEWRGVIVGWERVENGRVGDSFKRPATSLTSKPYALDTTDQIKYSILLDSGDAHLHYEKRREPGELSLSETNQSDLHPVEDPR
jgi:hypothetical protein